MYICQKSKPREKLSSTDTGRNKLLNASNILKDGLFDEFSDNDMSSVKYHSNSCYKPYALKSERQPKLNETAELSSIDNSLVEDEPSQPRAKRRKSSDVDTPKICVICQKIYSGKDSKLYRLCENDRADLFLSATRFNLDEVFTRTSLYDTKEKLFAAGILSHKKCMNRYLLQYKRDMDQNISYNLEDFDEELKEQFRIMTENLDLDNNAYTVSYCCNFLNEKLNQNINNRQVKSLLIDHYGENICFTYPKDRKKSQMFFSTALRQVDVVESLRNKTSTSDIISCAKTLESDIKLFKFQLDESNCDANDVATCQSDMKVPDTWHIFMKHLCGQRSMSDEFDRKSYVIFQQVYYFVHNGTKKTPLHVSIAQSIHNERRSKKLIKTMNRLGISISYDELERIDFTLANRLLNRLGEHRVPISNSIKKGLLHRAMDNFDHIEDTKSGKGSSHDTILMVFQNQNENNEEHVSTPIEQDIEKKTIG